MIIWASSSLDGGDDREEESDIVELTVTAEEGAWVIPWESSFRWGEVEPSSVAAPTRFH